MIDKNGQTVDRDILELCQSIEISELSRAVPLFPTRQDIKAFLFKLSRVTTVNRRASD